MPFIRQTRDKRGFEHTAVMHTGRPGSGHARPKVLYIFRSPGNLKVGRKALDGEVREALEHTHPDLNFDWNSLTREAVVMRAEPQPPRPQRGARPRPQAPPAQSPAPTPPPAPLPDDPSLLGQTLGAATAARLRGRFSEVSQRIVRRARTPEERDALTERAKRLNPDGWLDQSAIREHASTVDRELDSLAAELPSRRRGRRGGRHRQEQAPGPSALGASGIMAGSEESHENSTEPSLDPSDRASDTGSDAGLSPAESEAGISSDD